MTDLPKPGTPGAAAGEAQETAPPSSAESEAPGTNGTEGAGAASANAPRADAPSVDAPSVGVLDDAEAAADAEAVGVDSEAPSGEGIEEPVELDELALARAALEERTADLQRLQAEYMNYRKRVDRDRELVTQNAKIGVLTELMGVLDDLDRAREAGELEGGFKVVAESLMRVTTQQGLESYGEPGEEFDPNVHEALMQREDDSAESTTVEVVAQPGYRIGDRVIRAAKVTVVGPA